MTAPVSPLRPRWCDHGCGIEIILAFRVDAGRWVPYEATDHDPTSAAASTCHVLVTDQAWRPADLIEHFQVRFEVTEDKARELAAGYPHHRPHFHTTDEETNP
jgi:hypothetical protein